MVRNTKNRKSTTPTPPPPATAVSASQTLKAKVNEVQRYIIISAAQQKYTKAKTARLPPTLLKLSTDPAVVYIKNAFCSPWLFKRLMENIRGTKMTSPYDEEYQRRINYDLTLSLGSSPMDVDVHDERSLEENSVRYGLHQLQTEMVVVAQSCLHEAMALHHVKAVEFQAALRPPSQQQKKAVGSFEAEKEKRKPNINTKKSSSSSSAQDIALAASFTPQEVEFLQVLSHTFDSVIPMQFPTNFLCLTDVVHRKEVLDQLHIVHQYYRLVEKIRPCRSSAHLSQWIRDYQLTPVVNPPPSPYSSYQQRFSIGEGSKEAKLWNKFESDVKPILSPILRQAAAVGSSLTMKSGCYVHGEQERKLFMNALIERANLEGLPPNLRRISLRLSGGLSPQQATENGSGPFSPNTYFCNSSSTAGSPSAAISCRSLFPSVIHLPSDRFAVPCQNINNIGMTEHHRQADEEIQGLIMREAKWHVVFADAFTVLNLVLMNNGRRHNKTKDKEEKRQHRQENTTRNESNFSSNEDQDWNNNNLAMLLETYPSLFHAGPDWPGRWDGGSSHGSCFALICVTLKPAEEKRMYRLFLTTDDKNSTDEAEDSPSKDAEMKKQRKGKELMYLAALVEVSK